METPETTTTSSEGKQITIEVPAERLAEFYAFFGQFLAGWPGRRRHGGHRGHRGHHHHHHCGGGQRAGGSHESETEAAAAGPSAGTATA
jgi:hypothetical protein